LNALTQLLSRDEQLKARFLILQANVVQTLQDLFDPLVLQGDMKSVDPPTTTRTLAHCCWMNWLSWLRFEQIADPSPLEARNDAVYDRIILNFGIVQAYCSKSFSANVFFELRKAVGVPRRSAVGGFAEFSAKPTRAVTFACKCCNFYLLGSGSLAAPHPHRHRGPGMFMET
jgi:hypothetical protein